MALTWEQGHFDPGATAFDGRFLVGQVAKYADTVPGTTTVLGHFYIGFVRGDPVSGRCATFDEAQEAVERRHGDGEGQRSGRDHRPPSRPSPPPQRGVPRRPSV